MTGRITRRRAGIPRALGKGQQFVRCEEDLVTYTLAALPPLPGGKTTIGKSLNNRGQIVGMSTTLTPNGDHENHAALWNFNPVDENEPVAQPEDLGTLGGHSSEANDVNDEGRIVGQADTAAGERHAFLWLDWLKMIDLGPGIAQGINKDLTIVGIGLDGRDWRAFYMDFPTKPDYFGPAGGQAFSVNDKKEVAGSTLKGALSSSPFFWSKNLGYIEAPIGGGAYSINEVSELVGGPDFGHMFEGAFGWLPGNSVFRLPAPPASIGLASSINENSEIVGHLAAPDQFRSYLWTAKDGYRDINELIDASDQAEWQLQDALRINDHGQIVGVGYHMPSSEWRGYLLRPKTPKSGRPPHYEVHLTIVGNLADGPSVIIFPPIGPVPPGPPLVSWRPKNR
jgi:probable HAF family extracellular repeat protein